MKKHQQDKDKAAELLKKLQESYLQDKEVPEKKKKESDADDRAFQEKLAGLLGKFSSSTKEKPKKSTKKASKPKKLMEEEPPILKEEAPTDPIQEELEPITPIEEVSVEEAAPAELKETTDPEEIQEAPSQPKPKKPRQKREKKAEAPVTVEEPTIEKSVTIPPEEPEEAIAEESPVITVKDTPLEEVPQSVEPEELLPEEPICEESKTAHPLDKVLPLVLEEAHEAPPVIEPIKTESLEEVIEEVEAPIEEALIPEAAPMPEEEPIPVARAAEAPQNITIAPPSTAPDFRKSAPRKDPDAIVIRPPATPLPNETIVIRPRAQAKPTATPQMIREPVSNTPIRIGKEVAQDAQKRGDNTPSELKKAPMKKEQSTTPAAPKAQQSTPPSPVPSKKDKPAVTLPRSTAKTTERKTTVKKASEKEITPAPFVENEALEEVLDEEIRDNELTLEEIPADEPEEVIVPKRKPSLFLRKQRQKQEQAEQKLSAPELIYKKSGLSEDDVALMFELGYENELGRLVGYENLKRLKSDHLKRVSKHDRKHYRTSFGYRGEELTGSRHREAVTAAYVHDRQRLLIRFVLTALISLLLFFVESTFPAESYFGALSLQYPLLFPLIGMGLFAACVLLSFRQVDAGWRSLFRFSPSPYTVSALIAPLVVAYDLAALFISTPMLKVNFTASLSLLLITVCDVLRLTCEMRALRILAADGTKVALSAATPRKIKLRRGEKIVKIINDDLGENRYQVCHCNQTVGFFRRFNSMESAARPFMILIAAMLAPATLAALADAVYTSSLPSALSAFMTVLMLTMPAGAIFTFFYPLCRANRLLYRKNSTLAGDEAVSELEGKKTVIFPDTELYTAQKYTEIAVREGDDIRTDLRLLSVLFRKLGGTLGEAGQAAKTLREDPPVAVVRVQENGVEAVVDDQYHMLVGSADFLRKGGVRIPKESSERALRQNSDIALMYVAVDSVLKLTCELSYEASRSFEVLIGELADCDANVALRTCDPNLNQAFLQRNRSEAAIPVQVIKLGRFEEEKPLELTDTAAVALGDYSDIVYPIYAAKGISELRHFGIRMQLIASLIGTAAAVLLTVFGLESLLGVLSIAGYQAFWVLVSWFATHSELNRETLHLK